MEAYKRIKMSAIQNAMNFHWLFTFLAAIAFADCVLMYRYDEGITLLSLEWMKSNIDIADLLIVVFVFSFSFAALIPGINYLLAIFYPHFEISVLKRAPEILSEREGWFHFQILKEKAAFENNSSLHKYCEEVAHEVSLKKLLSICAQGIFLFQFGSWVFSPKGVDPIVVVLFKIYQAQPWYIETPLNLATGIFLLVVLSMIGWGLEKHTSYIKVPERYITNA